MSSGVLVLLEFDHGAPTSFSLHIISRARQLGAGPVSAAVIGSTGEEAPPLLAGVEKIYWAPDARLRSYHSGLWTAAVAAIVRAADPVFVLAPSGPLVNDFLPRAATRIGAALSSNCMDVDLVGDGQVRVLRPLFEGRVFEEVELAVTAPHFVSLLPVHRLLDKHEISESSSPVEVVALEVRLLPVDSKLKVVRVDETHSAPGPFLQARSGAALAWLYGEVAPEEIDAKVRPFSTGEEAEDRCSRFLSTCGYCRRPTVLLGERSRFAEWHSERIVICANCGWWCALKKSSTASDSGGVMDNYYLARGLLKAMDVSNISAPLEELQAYLVAKYSARFDLHPKRLEDIVGSVFSAHGYQVRATSYSGDEGIDLFVLDGESNDAVGVQVKRYRNKIKAEQIRAFTGALMLARLTRGIFVTTSSFQRGAEKATEKLGTLEYHVDLWDAETFYDRLSIARAPSYIWLEDPHAPFFDYWNDLKRLSSIGRGIDFGHGYLRLPQVEPDEES